MGSDSIDLIKELKKKKFDVSSLNDDDSPCTVSEWLPTGCLPLDTIMGGGYPVGRVTEIFGENSTGKSLIAAQAVAMAQESGWIPVYVDTETAVSKAIMKSVGVDIDDLIYWAPDTVEEVFSLFEEAVTIKAEKYPDKRMLLIWDSVAATSIEEEMEADYGKSMMGRHASRISQAMRKFTRVMSSQHIAGLFLNQEKTKIGVMFGDKATTFGGKAIGFHASIRIQLKNSQKLRSGKKILGITTRATCIKNKVSIPFLSCILPIYFGYGVDDALSSFYYLRDGGLLKASGSYYSLEGLNLKKFQKSQWEAIFDKHYDEIADIISKTEVTEDHEEQEAEE